MKKCYAYALFTIFFTCLFACQDDINLTNKHVDTTPENYVQNHLFSDIVEPDFKEKMHLGRILFYDNALSINNKVACASCHSQAAAFSDPFKHSIGIGSQLSERNTPSIVNAGFSSGLFWDQRALNLHDLVLQPVLNHKEMGFSSLEDVSRKLSQIDYYQELFRNAYGSATISSREIADALTTFCQQLSSFDSDFDQGILTPHQHLGLSLFKEKGCNSCHQVVNDFLVNDILTPRIEPGFAGNGIGFGYTGAGRIGEVANIGLDASYEDQGIALLSGLKFDEGKFKIPTLRNINRTAPYMHDGRFNTLKEVLDFYDDGVAAHPNLDFRLSSSGLDLSEPDKAAIIDFLHALESKDVLTNPHFSDPFGK